MESRFFQTSTGLRLHYLSHACANPASSSYCILLHGFTNDAHVWDALAADLQRSHHVIALDHRGHGDSDWDAGRNYSHWQLAADLQEFLASIGGATLHVVGHSLGARVALLALETFTSGIASLTLIDAGPEVNPEAAERLLNDALQLPPHFVDAQAWRDSLARIYVMADAAALEHIASFGLRVRQGRLCAKTDPAFTPGIWHSTPQLQALHNARGTLSEQLWTALRSLTVPVHIVRGQASSILEPALAARMAQALGDGTVVSVVPRAGHAVMLDNPAASATVITQFIAAVGKIAPARADRQGSAGKRT